MADQICGKNAYAYVGGNAVVHLTDWEFNSERPPIDLDPDIGSSRVPKVAGFIQESGSISYNFTSDDFPDLFDAYNTGTAVALYLYPEKGSSKIYLYGNAFLTSITHTNPLLATVTGSCSWVSSDTTGFSRQTTAA